MLPWFLLVMFFLSFAISVVAWFVMVVLIGHDFNFLDYWRLVFLTPVVFLFLLNILVTCVIESVQCLKLMKKFETTQAKINKAVFNFGLLKRENKKIREGSKEDFDEWFKRREFACFLAEHMFKRIFF